MAIDNARQTLVLTLRQRCFYLFAALLLLLTAVPFLEGSPLGRVLLNGASLLVLLMAAGVVVRGDGAVVIGVLLALPAALFQIVALFFDMPHLLTLAQAFAAAVYFVTVSYLLTYVLRRQVLTVDKLYGAAAAYLMMGVLWAYLYVILLKFYPGALTFNGTAVDAMPFSTTLYFSFVTLTATGMSDVMPIHPIARMLCQLEMICGVLFIAVLIARLASTYPAHER